MEVIYDYPGYEEGELALSAGEMVKVYDNTTFHEWWKGEVNGKVGIFPSNYVKVVQASDSTIKMGKQPHSTNNSDESFILANAVRLEAFHRIASSFDPKLNLTENEELQDHYSKILVLRPRILKELHSTHAKFGKT